MKNMRKTKHSAGFIQILLWFRVLATVTSNPIYTHTAYLKILTRNLFDHLQHFIMVYYGLNDYNNNLTR